MTTLATDWPAFIGRLHPLLVHMPIGMLAAVLVFEIARAWSKSPGGDAARRLSYLALAASGGASAAAGWLLAEEAAYDGGIVFWHRWMGIGLAVVLAGAFVTAWPRGRRASLWRVGLLLGGLGLVTVTGHLGGTLTHGEGYLTRHAPVWLGGSRVEEPAAVTVADSVSGADAEIVLAMLEDRCVSCHGSTKVKANLRLDQADGVRSVVVPGDPASSELFRRISLGHADDDLMPPDGDPLDEATVLAVMRWIRDGARMETVRARIDAVTAHSAAENARLEAARAATGAVVAIVPQSGATLVRVDYSRTPGVVGAQRLQTLGPLAGDLVELSLAGCSFDAAVVAATGPYERLTRLHLERSDIDDAGLAQLLESAPRVEYLNLHSTSISDASLAAIARLTRLRRLVLFGTRVSADEMQRLRAAMPSLELTGKVGLAEGFSGGGPRMILAADASKGRIALLRESALGQPETVWEHPVQAIHDLHRLANGHILFQDSWTRLVEVDPATGETVWTYDAAVMNRARPDERVEIHAFERLADGSTMIAESGPARIIEVGPDGTLLHQVALAVDRPDPHHDTRLVRSTPGGTYLVAHEADGVVREYDRSGAVVWSFDVPLEREPAPGHSHGGYGDQVFSAIRLRSGNTLIGTGNGHGVLEVDPGGSIVWRVDADELEGVRLAWVTTVQELANGNIVITNCHAGPDQPQIVEITREKRVVWSFADFDRFGNALSNSLIIEDDRHDNRP